jgi:hypothetical protein
MKMLLKHAVTLRGRPHVLLDEDKHQLRLVPGNNSVVVMVLDTGEKIVFPYTSIYYWRT